MAAGVAFYRPLVTGDLNIAKTGLIIYGYTGLANAGYFENYGRQKSV